jgi:hypothetical protein
MRKFILSTARIISAYLGALKNDLKISGRNCEVHFELSVNILRKRDDKLWRCYTCSRILRALYSEL